MQRFAQNLVFNEAPKLIRQLPTPSNQAALQRGIERGIQIGMEVLAIALSPAPTAISAGRPVTNGGVPTAQRARKLRYAPDLAGQTGPGEIVWTWMVNDTDPTRGQDCPVLIVGRDRSTLLGLLVSGDPTPETAADWVDIGFGNWDYQDRPSRIRLDRVLDVPEDGIRREGIIIPRDIFETVADRLRTHYSWG